MNFFIRTKRSLLLAFALLSLLLAVGTLVSAQNCNCVSNFCCSQYGFCGSTDAYCGPGCQGGPCNGPPQGNTGGTFADIVTDNFFNSIINQSGTNCRGKNFYTRAAFLTALNSYTEFGNAGSKEDSKREIAAFFAHATHETGHFCYTEEIGGKLADYCDENNKEYPCESSEGYYGRGPFQLSWNYNYGAAGKAILGSDLLKYPGNVASDPIISFETALWFWMGNCHGPFSSGKGFGSTISAINGALECNGKNPATVEARVKYYTTYCTQLGVDPGANQRC